MTSIHPFTAAFNSVASGNASTLATLLAGQSISAASNDPYGAQENNNGGTPSVSYVLPMYTTATVGGSATQACVTNTADPQRQGNKLGSYAYLRFTAPANRNYQFTVSPPAGSSPNFVIYRGGAVSRNTNTVSLSIGEYVLVVNDVNNAGANTCFSVSIQ